MSGVLRAARSTSARDVAAVGILTLAWCALWGDLSVANVMSGLVVAMLARSFGLANQVRSGVRLWPLVRFGALVLVDLVRSVASVAGEIVTRSDSTEEAIIAVRAPLEARAHLLLLVVAVTVTPGTAVVDADPDTGMIYLHLLHADRAEATAAHVLELADLACRALPVADPVQAEATP